MNLNDICKDIFIINLDRREDRWAHCSQQIDKFGFKAEKIKAVDGSGIFNPTSLSPSNYALLLSHRLAIEMAKERGLREVIILEDDADFVENLNERLKEVEEVPTDWDIIYLGANLWHLGAGKQPPVSVGENIYRVYDAFTTHALYLRDTAFDSVLIEIDKLDRPLDIIYTGLQKQLNAYAFKKNLAAQYDSHSDISGFNTQYKARGLFD